MISSQHSDSILESSMGRLLNKKCEALFQLSNYEECSQIALNAFSLVNQMESIFWYCKSEATLRRLRTEVINMINQCMLNNCIDCKILESILTILERTFGLQTITKLLYSNELSQKALLKVMLNSDNLPAIEKAKHLLDVSFESIRSEEMQLLVENLYEETFAAKEYQLSIRLLSLFTSMLDSENDNYAHNYGVVTRKRVDCLLRMGELKEAEQIINRHSHTEACWVVRAFTLRILRQQYDLAELCFDQVLIGEFYQEALFCISSAQDYNREFSLNLHSKYILKRGEKCESIAAKSLISVCAECSVCNMEVLEVAFGVLLKAKKDYQWCLCASWSFVAMSMNNRNFSVAIRMIKICQSFTRKEDSVDSFILLYFELLALLELEGQEERICNVFEKFNDNKDLIDGQSVSTIFNLTVKDLLKDTSSLEYRVCLYRKEYSMARSIIDSCDKPCKLLQLVKLTLYAKCNDSNILIGLANRAQVVAITGADIYFLARCLLLLLSDPRDSRILDSLSRLIQDSTELENEEELIWIIVFMHNTALDLMAMHEPRVAKQWSETALRLCANLPTTLQENYEKAVRGAFLTIIQHGPVV